MKQFSNDIPFDQAIRRVLDACADCDTCRFLMDESCLFFPELYRLYDQETELKKPVTDTDLQNLADRCTLCGLCPCPDIRMNIIQSRIARIRENGLSPGIRFLTDVGQLGRLCGLFPNVLNACLSIPIVDRTVRHLAGIHSGREIPKIPRENFFSWAHRNGLDRKSDSSPKVAYFAGCTAGYFFPEVAKATVSLLMANQVAVYVPEQRCCGMPMLLEGDADRAIHSMGLNMDTLLETVADGYDPVCSCPTCGFLMKVLLKEGACYSEAYQRAVHAESHEIRVPDRSSGKPGFVSLKKSLYPNILTDDGCFSRLDPVKRMALSDRMLDMGEYLHRMYRENRLNTRLGRIASRMAIFVPCHQREQNTGSPYETLLSLIPGLEMVRVGGVMDCCGMGGNLGYKDSFYEYSLKVGRPLFQKIQAAKPDGIVTECLSCRLQFEHVLPYPVFHPLEVLARSYQMTRVKNDGIIQDNW